MKTKRILSMLMVLLLLVAAGCGGGGGTSGANATTLSGADGVTIEVPSKWNQVTSEDELADEFFDDGDLDVVLIAATLDKGNGGYMTVEKYDATGDLAGIDEFIEEIRVAVADDKDGTIEILQEMGYTAREIDLLIAAAEAADSSAAQDYLIQEFYLQDWLYSLEADESAAYQLNNLEDWTIDGKKVQVADYQYTNSSGTALQFYEANILHNENYYCITVWNDVDNFAKNKEAYKNIVTSFKIAP